MQGGIIKKLRGFRVALSLYLLIAILVVNFGDALIRNSVPIAEAAQVAVDGAVNITSTSHLQMGSQTVFIDDQTGYKFYRDGAGGCVYSKTIDGGTNWDTPVTVDVQTDCIAITVWYDRWTSGDTGNYIHILTMDTSLDDLFYNRLDTASSDTLLKGSSPVDVSTNSGNSIATLTTAANKQSLTKGTDGTLYATVADASDSYVVECTSSCELTTGWTETGTNPLDLANDYSILVPLMGGNIMLVNRDISLEDIRTKIWDNANWSASWTIVDANATDNATYDGGLAVTVSSTTPGTVYLAYTADNATLGTDDDVRTAVYSGGSWTNKTDVIANTATRAITSVTIAVNGATDDVYVGYSARTTAGTPETGNVYWKKSTDGMTNWGAEQGPMNTAGADDIYGIDFNNLNDERIYGTWYEATEDAVYGDTVEDIFLGVLVSSTGSQIANTYASTTNVYIGGVLSFVDSYASHDVTGITITESGTIDGSIDVSNVKLFYETDITAPYDCASESYNGTESQFGSTDINGFSGADGVSSFTGTTVNVGTTTALCIYPVMDILDSTASNATIDVSIANPQSDVVVTDGLAGPATAVSVPGSTNVYNDTPTQVHYHWRNDNGTEITATSKTSGNEDTSLTALQQVTPVRVRVGISNEGSSSTPAIQYRLEYAQTSDVCSSATGWIDVGDVGGDFDMYNTANLTDGNNTTNIAVASGGVTNENITFLSPNGGVKDTSSQTSGVILSSTQYVDLEYSIVASTTATEGNTYCFRVTDQGNPLPVYNAYPRANIAADVSVTATSTQITSANLPATNFYIGGAFVLTENSSSRNVTSITITASGTIDAMTDISNIKLYYDIDTTAPYNCGSESYGGGELQFGTTDTDGFSGSNGTSTFSGAVGISTTTSMCVYTVFDTTAIAQNGETLDILIQNPSSDVVVTGGGSVSPTIARNIDGVTTFQGAVLTQTHYHWRNDNGSEAGATSMTGGVEDTPVTNISQSTPVRLRAQVSNEGAISSASRAFQLEYGTKITSCSAVGTWTNVSDSGGAFDIYNSTNLTEGSDTTDIAVGVGGVTNENTTFLTPNSAVKDTSSVVASTTVTSSQFIETEFSIQQTIDAGYDTTYCFRLSTTEVELNSYVTYPELTTSPERDFEIQRGTVTIAGTSATITAGVDYTAPSASTSAFIRITNSHHTGAGDNSLGGTQNADDVTAYILNPSDIMTSVTFQRPSTAISNTRVSWEIVEFIGAPGSDNEMIVRGQGTVDYTTTSLTATTSVVSNIIDDADVVAFITGVGSPDTGTADYNTMQSTSAWLSSTDQATFTRGEASGDATVVSYAIVEFTGPNWIVQRSEHTYANAGTTETEAITAVNSLSRTMLHVQKRVGTALPGMDEFGHEVWLSSIGYVSYILESGATTPTEQTSVAWIIENTQITSGAMDVVYSNGNTTGGAEPLTLSVEIGKILVDLTNASIFVNTRSAGTGTTYPRPIAGATIASSTHYELWRSDTGTNLSYRTIIVEWPTAGLAIKQNYYRFYVHNNLLDPTDPWPVGGIDLGENTVLTGADEPLGENEILRIRMSLRALNATFPLETKSFKLQYGAMDTTCSAISAENWHTVGDSASSTVWRGYNATGTNDGAQLSGNPPTGGDLNLSVSDRAGTMEEQNDTDVNMYSVQEGEDIEYDWLIEQNGANAETYYCFRMVESDGTQLAGYNNYPQLRTASFTPKTQNWRWYSDSASETPTLPMANENVSPSNFANGSTSKLRITVKETENISRDDVRFKLQYSEYANFAVVDDAIASSTCTATSTWCYANGGGVDNAKIASSTLSDSASCVGGVGNGCGTHNESPDVITGFRHNAGVSTEYEFTVQSAGPRVNRVYYFRLYDVVQDIPVVTNTGESYPSLATEGASLSFAMDGLASSTVIEGVTLDIDTSPSSLDFGSLTASSTLEGAHRLAVDTDGTEGYQLLMYMDGDLMSSSGSTIKPITGTNATPSSWVSGCSASAPSCFGYHTSDDTLEGGSTRFSAIDTYAQVNTTTPEIVAYSTQPAFGEVTDVIFRIIRRELQEAGLYEARIRYISVPMF